MIDIITLALFGIIAAFSFLCWRKENKGGKCNG